MNKLAERQEGNKTEEKDEKSVCFCPYVGVYTTIEEETGPCLISALPKAKKYCPEPPLPSNIM